MHHIITYNCLKTAHVAEREGHITECWSANMPDEWGECIETSIVWNVGGVVSVYFCLNV